MQGYIHFYFDSFSIFVVRRQDQEQALNGGAKLCFLNMIWCCDNISSYLISEIITCKKKVTTLRNLRYDFIIFSSSKMAFLVALKITFYVTRNLSRAGGGTENKIYGLYAALVNPFQPLSQTCYCPLGKLPKNHILYTLLKINY